MQPIPLQGSAWAAACQCRITAFSLQQECSELSTFPSTWLGKLAGEPETWCKEWIQGMSRNLLVLTPGDEAHTKKEWLIERFLQRGSAPSWPFLPALLFSYILPFYLLWNDSALSCSESTSIPVGKEQDWSSAAGPAWQEVTFIHRLVGPWSLLAHLLSLKLVFWQGLSEYLSFLHCKERKDCHCLPWEVCYKE